jgi:hypothetical protein
VEPDESEQQRESEGRVVVVPKFVMVCGWPTFDETEVSGFKPANGSAGAVSDDCGNRDELRISFHNIAFVYFL